MEKDRKKIKKMVRQLKTVNRRIDNMRYLVVFKERDRDRLTETIREKVTGIVPEIRYIDHDPDGSEGGTFKVRAVKTPEGMGIISVTDHDLLQFGMISMPEGWTDMGEIIIPNVLAMQLGEEWITNYPTN